MDLAGTGRNGKGNSGDDIQKTIENEIHFQGPVMDHETIPVEFTRLVIALSVPWCYVRLTPDLLERFISNPLMAGRKNPNP